MKIVYYDKCLEKWVDKVGDCLTPAGFGLPVTALTLVMGMPTLIAVLMGVTVGMMVILALYVAK